jgi:hypothetical protein
MSGLQVEQEPEAVEVPFDIIITRIPLLKRQVSEELRLSRCIESDWDGRNPNLRAFGIKVAAETLEVGAKMQHEAA